MKTIGCKLEEVAWAIVTHFHMDHAGLISDFLDRGVTCFIFENQVGAVDSMEKTIVKNDKTYKLIDKGKLQPLNTKDSRPAREAIGIIGEVLVTDALSTDSIAFILLKMMGKQLSEIFRQKGQGCLVTRNILGIGN
jgi:glyoxylase-like metal-dependent hydrolase (beta-lactamase superfamily II)